MQYKHKVTDELISENQYKQLHTALRTNYEPISDFDVRYAVDKNGKDLWDGGDLEINHVPGGGFRPLNLAKNFPSSEVVNLTPQQ